MILVILAGGIGSRFGGLKQLSPVDDEGNYILDYSIFDAIQSGFKKVVFIIKEENYQIFRETIGSRVENYIETAYVFQNNDNIPFEYNIPDERKKPFGTAHALLCAEKEIDDNFLVINADDFYGREAFEEVAKVLNNKINKNECLLVGYKLKDTISESGNVKRGICEVDGEYIVNIKEYEIHLDGDEIYAKNLENNNSIWQMMSGDEIVSMNMLAFNKDIFSHLRKGFENFLEINKDNLISCEYFLPTIVNQLIKEEKIKVKVLKTQSKWQGITYKEDLQNFIKFIKNMKKSRKYSKKLWNF